MSDNNVDLMSDYKVETSFGSCSNALHPSPSNDNVGPKIIVLYDDYGLKMVFENLMEEETSYFGPLGILISNVS